MHLKSLGFVYNFLDDPAFHKLTMCLDNKMKENAAKGLGRTVHKAETLDVSHIAKLWEDVFWEIQIQRNCQILCYF